MNIVRFPTVGQTKQEIFYTVVAALKQIKGVHSNIPDFTASAN